MCKLNLSDVFIQIHIYMWHIVQLVIRPISYTSNKKSMTFQNQHSCICSRTHQPEEWRLWRASSMWWRFRPNRATPCQCLPTLVNMWGWDPGTHDLKNGKATFKKPNGMIPLHLFWNNEGRSVLHVDNNVFSKKNININPNIFLSKHHLQKHTF